ncbi:MAG: alpha/beta fold hydrolase [Candidatus Lokiarchaeota archaeon]|nr:alpha/beta fold hydrolase [Candidatus Lokiarchaeota archaeon]
MTKKLLIDNPTVSNIVFYPRKTPIPKETDPNIKVLKFQIEKNVLIGGFFYLNNPEFPTILLFHGNGEIASDYQYFLDFFFRCGINLTVVDFRGYGFSTGSPFYTSLIIDALPIYNKFHKWLVENSLNDSIFILGRSLGSVCASEIGSHNPESLKGIIFESGFASLYDMMTRLFRVSGQEINPESLSEYSNDTRIRKILKPILVIHGTVDWIIPSTQGKLIYENIFEGIEKKLVLIEGAGHNDIFSYEDEYLTPLTVFIQKFR